MGAWTLPAELDQPLPRPVKRRWTFTLTMVSQAGVSLIFVLFVAGMAASNYYGAETLKEHGVQAAGTVTRLYTVGGKGGPSYNVTYAYPLLPKPAHSATDRTNLRNFEGLHVGDAVPIAYDPANPQHSALNFDDVVFTRDNTRALTPNAIVLVLFLVTSVAVPLVLLREYARQRRLLQWGKATAATIVSDTEYNAGRAGRKSAVAYAFTDEAGRSMQGKRSGLPVKRARNDAMYTEMFGDSTVLFDPNDSTKNMLYPFSLAECPTKPEPSVFSPP